MADHFTAVADSYRLNRPDYPPALFDWLAEQAGSPQRAWDVGCGSGQASHALAQAGWQVLATDLSSAQLQGAARHPRLHYAVASAEQAPLADASVALVTVAQAAHWFDLPRFYTEVQRVMPGGLLALWTYTRPLLPGTLDKAFVDYHQGVLGPWWPKQRKLVDDGYRNLAFPFATLAAPELSITRQWTLDQLLGYADSWSATGRYQAAGRGRVRSELAAALAPQWPAGEAVEIRWPLRILAARLGS